MVALNVGIQSQTALLSKAIDTASSGAQTLIAGVNGQIIRVFKLYVVAAGSVTLEFLDGSNELAGAASLIVGEPLVLPLDGFPWFTTSPGNAFVGTLGGSVQVGGVVL
jgi:hypothetical protein